MPELPDITVYIEALDRRIAGARFDRVRLFHPFLLRSVAPPLSAVDGRTVRRLRRLGKRIVIELGPPHHNGDRAGSGVPPGPASAGGSGGHVGAPDQTTGLFLVIHLMIAGRLHWKVAGARPPGKIGLAAFDFSTGTLILTEAGTKRRAAIHVVEGEDALREHDPGGLEPLDADLETFRERLTEENHTLKRALTDPGIFAGIGNAYSDEILHRAQLSPVKQTQKLAGEEIERLHTATREALLDWCERLRQEAGDEFPEGVTAFRPDMAVHGRYGQPCPRCGAPVQRIVYAENETNYCTQCQTGGKLLADRSLSRLMRGDWPRTLEELENRRRGR